MDNAEKTAEKCVPVVDVMPMTTEEAVDSILPAMNVAVPQGEAPQAGSLISDEEYLGVLQEIMSNIREERKEAADLLNTFSDMVFNDGDATTSSKEALVNLVKHKADLQDKMLKAATLMTQLKLKNTYAYSGPHLNAMQQNNFNIGPGAEGAAFSKKELIKAINQVKKKNKE